MDAPAGLSRVDGDDTRSVDVAVVVLATDERLYFVSSGADGKTDAGSLRYDRLAAVDVDGDVLELSTVDGVVWRVPLADPTDPTVDAMVRHLAWIGAIRSRVVASKNDVDLAAGEIADAADEMDWERGAERYETQRAALDELLDAVFRTEPVSPAALAPEVTDLERTIERAYAELLIERSHSRLTLGEQLVRTADHERARTVMAGARADYDAARSHAEAVQRGDAFVFGEQRALTDRLDRLGWEIEAVAAEPLRRAHEAKILARTTSDPGETVEHWETAFRRYGDVLTLQREGDGQVAGDVPEVRRERENAAGQLIAIHRALSRNQWDDGIDRAAADVDAGVAQLESAVDHLERARELADQFRPDATSDMDDRLEKMRDGIDRLRETPTFTRVAPDEKGATATDARADAPDGRDAPPVEADEDAGDDLANIDSHHDIQIDGEVGDTDRRRSDGTRSDGSRRELDRRGDVVLPDPDDSE